MAHSSFLRRMAMLAVVCLLSCCVTGSAFLIGTEEDLQALIASGNISSNAGENTAPIAQNIELSTYKNVAIQEKFLGTDPEGDAITFRITKKPARGAVTISEDGIFTYTPYENKTGKDSFTFVAEDARGAVSEPATVKLRIEKPSTKVRYADMEGHPAHKAAIRLAEQEILVGERLGNVCFFRPAHTVTREEFLAMAMDTVGLKRLTDATTTGFFDDATIAVWAKPYIASALRSGMVQGVSNAMGQAEFQAGNEITQAEAGVLLDRLLGLSDVTSTAAVKEEQTPAWAQQSSANLEAVGVFQTMEPQELLTRADCAVMLSGALDLLEFRHTSGFS